MIRLQTRRRASACTSWLLRASIARVTAVTLLGPGTPMLFQGQEFDASARFLFFADLPEWLIEPVRKGRKEFMTQWRSAATPAMAQRLADPVSSATFEACMLDHSERERNAEAYKFHCDLIALKRTDPVLSAIPRMSAGRRRACPRARLFCATSALVETIGCLW